VKKYKTRLRAVCSYKARGDLSEHERSVEKHDAKRSSSQHFSSVVTNTFIPFTKCFITAHSTADNSYINKYKSLISFARSVGRYKARATANQIARNMSGFNN
jgi:hypothetical protein